MLKCEHWFPMQSTPRTRAARHLSGVQLTFQRSTGSQVIDCPNCKISFSPRNARCPRCDQFETPRDQHQAFWKRDARARIEDGYDPRRVRADLLACGIAETDADSIIGRAQSAQRSVNRQFGCVRLVVAIAMIVTGLLFVIGGVFVLRGRGGSRMAVVSMIGGLGLIGSGLLAGVSSFATIASGR